jgi:hypothetical protein
VTGFWNGSADEIGLTDIPADIIPGSSGKQAMLLMLEFGVEELTGI